VIKNKRQEMH